MPFHFRKLKHSPRGSAPITELDGSVLTNKPAKLIRWMEHFCTLLNRPPAPGSQVIDEAAAMAIVDPSIQTDPSDVMEIARVVGRLKNGKASGICNIYRGLGGLVVIHSAASAKGPGFNSTVARTYLRFNSRASTHWQASRLCIVQLQQTVIVYAV